MSMLRSSKPRQGFFMELVLTILCRHGRGLGENFIGPNLLGRLLMELRDNGTLEYRLPVDALDFVEVMKNGND